MQVKESEEFRLLPVEQLIEIISSDDLNVRSEEHVYKAVITWMKHDVNERRPLLPKVCQRAAIERELEHNIVSLFLVAGEQLYIYLCPSVSPSVAITQHRLGLGS